MTNFEPAFRGLPPPTSIAENEEPAVKIDRAQVDYIAKLAQLAVTEEEKQEFIGQMNSILEYVEQLNQLDTHGIEPTAQAVHTSEQNYSWRADRSEASFTQEESLRNGPATGSGHFKVPKVISEK